MSGPSSSWTERDPAGLAPVVLVAGGFLTTPGWYRPMADALRARGAADVVVARVYPPDWVLVAIRGLGPVVTRVGRALLEAGSRSRSLAASGGAPILLVGHSAGGIVGRLLTSPEPFDGRRLAASVRIGALVTLGSPHQVGDDTRWGSRVAAAGVRFANRHVPGATFAPTTAYLAAAARLGVGRAAAADPRSLVVRRLYEDLWPAPGERLIEGDGVVPVAAALLPGAHHLVLPDAVHGPGLRVPWYRREPQRAAWWPPARAQWRGAHRVRLARPAVTGGTGVAGAPAS